MITKKMVTVSKNTKQTEFFVTPIDGINKVPKTKDFNEKFRVVEEMVAHLMEKYPHTKKDYNLLWLMYLKESGIAEINIDTKKYFKAYKVTTISRAKRKIFEEAKYHDKKGFYKEFLESDEEIENKKAKEKTIRRYFKK